MVDTAEWINYRKEDFNKARALLLGVAEKAKDMPVFFYHLGMTYLRLGEKDKAKKYLHLATKSKKPFPGKTEAQKTLEELG